MIALSASTLVNAGPEPLDLFGVSDWREGCPTLRRHDHGNSPVRPMTVDAPLPPAPQIGPFVGQMQHTNDIRLRSAPNVRLRTPRRNRCEKAPYPLKKRELVGPAKSAPDDLIGGGWQASCGVVAVREVFERGFVDIYAEAGRVG